MMKKLFITVGLVAVLPFTSFAQESVGFSNPDNIQPLLDYRLPAWGYSNIYFDFSLSGDFSSMDASGPPIEDQTRNLFAGQLAPVYTRVRHSDPRISSYLFRPDFQYSYIERNQPTSRTTKRYVAGFTTLLSEKLYFNHSDLFFIGRNQTRLSQSESRRKIKDVPDETNTSELQRLFNTHMEIGIGFGRVRVVNPAVRALRLHERMQALDPAMGIIQNDLFAAAEHFTAYNSYQSAYDRPQKYFWGDMDQLISADFAALSAFDMLYLIDVLKENLGQRREGWEVMTTLAFRYATSYTNNTSDTIGMPNSLFLTPIVSGEWSKNISLNHQLRLISSFQYSFDIERESSGDNRGTLRTSAEWLYTITDRFLINSSVNYVRRTWSGSDQTESTYIISSDFSYFLEDRVSVFGDINYIHSSSLTSSKELIFNAGIRYYLRRQLF